MNISPEDIGDPNMLAQVLLAVRLDDDEKELAKSLASALSENEYSSEETARMILAAPHFFATEQEDR